MPADSARRWFALWLAGCALGCGGVGPRFERDELLHEVNGLTAEQSASIDAALAKLFGTPDAPRLPADLPQLAELLDPEALQQAAGPVISHTPGVTQGLYRRHCARCHGVTGDGRGPTALYQAPYPRDFRRGVFKWKSTYRGTPPTTANLHAVLERGVPGTGMPSFALLKEEEREILRQYVQYLAIRGQTERALVSYVADELPSDQPFDSSEDASNFLAEYLEPIAASWIGAETRLLATPTPTSGPKAIALGRQLYHGERAGCYKCHGPEGLGDSVAGKDYEVDYDVWSLERATTAGSDRARELIALDLPARTAMPRALVGSTLHGGSSRAALFRRLHQGIAGTTMPAIGGGSLSDEEIASLASYVETLLAPRSGETVVPPLAQYN